MRRFWMAGGIGIGLCLGFLVLLVVGTYSAAAGLAGGGGGRPLGLVKGACRRSTRPWCRSGAPSARR